MEEHNIEEYLLSKKEESMIASMRMITNLIGLGAKRHCASILRSYPEPRFIEFISTKINE